MPIYLPEIWYSIGKLHLTINLLVHIQLVGHEFSLCLNGLDDEWNLTKSFQTSTVLELVCQCLYLILTVYLLDQKPEDFDIWTILCLDILTSELSHIRTFEYTNNLLSETIAVISNTTPSLD
jgi:hypothetical protein